MTDDSVWQPVSDASTMWETSLGGSDEVPADPQNMNPGELSRTFTGMFEKVASFEAGLGVLPNPASDCSSENGRNFMFALKTNLVGSVNPVSVPTTTTTTTTPPCLTLNIGSAVVKHNNLNGDNNSWDNAETLHLGSVATVGDTVVDLVITATDGYVSNGNDGVFHDFGRLNMLCGKTGQFTFRFVDDVNGEPVNIDRLCWSFADLDTGLDGKCTESVTMGGFDSYYVAKGSELNVASSSDDDTMTFTASTHGTGSDNPQDPVAMSNLQASRSVGLVFTDVSVLTATVAVSEGPPSRGRNVFFAGGSVVVS
jgi:hypothetical protein